MLEDLKRIYGLLTILGIFMLFINGLFWLGIILISISIFVLVYDIINGILGDIRKSTQLDSVMKKYINEIKITRYKGKRDIGYDDVQGMIGSLKCVYGRYCDPYFYGFVHEFNDNEICNWLYTHYEDYTIMALEFYGLRYSVLFREIVKKG